MAASSPARTRSSMGFVDELGNFDTAVQRAKILTHIRNANLIEYRVPFDLGSVLSRVFGKTESPALKVDLGFDLPSSRPASFISSPQPSFPTEGAGRRIFTSSVGRRCCAAQEFRAEAAALALPAR